MHQLVSEIIDPERVIVESSVSGRATLIISGSDEHSTKNITFQ